jgi:hypothetical protein
MINLYMYPKGIAALAAGFAIALLVLLAPAAALADQAGAQAEGEYASPEAHAEAHAEAAEALEVSDEKLQQFLAAAINVQDVQREYVAEIQAAEDPVQAETLREEAQEEMVTAVEESGLSVLEFNLIAQRLQSDAELVQRLDSLQRE